MKRLIMAAVMVVSGWFAVPRAAAQYTSTVDPSTIWVSSWEGWGCPLCWWANCPLGTNDALLDMLYTTNYVTWNSASLPGLGYNIVRYNLGACSSNSYGGVSIYAPDIGTYQKMDAFWTNWASADPGSSSWGWARDGYQRGALLGAKARGANVFEMFANSPVWWMLYNYDPAGSYSGTTNNLQSWNYDQDAVYLATVARYAQTNWGVTFTSVEAFNEPVEDWWKYNGGQEGCHFDNGTQASVIGYLNTEMNNRGLNSTIISASDDNNITDATNTWNSFNSTTRSQIGRINVHGYGGLNPGRTTLYQQALSSGKDLWVSEYGENDTSGLTMVQNLEADFASLHESAWCYWLPYEGANWGFINTALPSLPTTVNPKYYAMAQFSRHIRPGMLIMASGSANVVAAYDPAAGKLVLVCANYGTAQNVTFNLANLPYVGGPVTRWETQMKGGSDLYAKFTDVTLSNKQFTESFPTSTVETFELQNVVGPGGAALYHDFNADGKYDYAMFNPTTGDWQEKNSNNSNTNGFHWGTAGDIPMVGNSVQSTDSSADAIVYRPSTGVFWVRNSETQAGFSVPFGTNGDVPFVGDFYGHGKSDYCVFNPNTESWWVKNSATLGTNNFNWGASGDTPLVGSVSKDACADAVVWHVDSTTGLGTFLARYSEGGSLSVNLGTNGDIPMLGDFTGDGKDDFVVFRPSNGTWYITDSQNTNNTITLQWGTSGDVPMCGKVSGNSKDDAIIFRPSNSQWYVWNTTTGSGISAPNWAPSGFSPVK
jgi:galactan endo-1,6-beta-galactosidase